jgi:hypothetical protein
MKYKVGGAVRASTYIGEVEADSPAQAFEEAYKKAHVSVCHQCAADIQDPEVADLWAEDADGNVVRENDTEASVLREKWNDPNANAQDFLLFCESIWGRPPTVVRKSKGKAKE